MQCFVIELHWIRERYEGDRRYDNFSIFVLNVVYQIFVVDLDNENEM